MSKEPKQTEPKSDIDLRLATIRRDCLSLAVQASKDCPSEVIELAEKMFNFVIGKFVPKTPTTAKELDAILNSESDKKLTVQVDGSVKKEWK